jgi:hypothetical protein
MFARIRLSVHDRSRSNAPAVTCLLSIDSGHTPRGERAPPEGAILAIVLTGVPTGGEQSSRERRYVSPAYAHT